MTRKKNRTISIVTTGEPVAAVLAARGDFAALIQAAIGDEWSDEFTSFDARDRRFPDPFGASAYVITGSAASVASRELWMLETEAWLREVVRAGVPTFGICFGHQILAQALGGEVRPNPRGREMGTVRIERLADDPIFDGLPLSFEANATHVDTVVVAPKTAVRLAKSNLEDNQALRFAQTCYGVQFHPEIDARVMRAYIDHRWEILANEGFSPAELASRVTDAEYGRRTLRNFVRHVIPRAEA